ncbi:gluconokinase [Shewanella sp. WXL01]|uniref:gluconokinase n=1 Tax=Shewanella sp. WXL01 TaxID=2709721 RepID=UPI001FD8FAA8|nr:gluconokinase [Shewanella sp. WXL01]
MKLGNQVIIVMGVSGSGKSTYAQRLAQHCQAKFIDGDDLHPRANIDKMTAGMPLTDQDREEWLTRINDAVYSLQHKNESGVIVCSALKQAYREQIRLNNQPLLLLYLKADKQLIEKRLTERQGHFMKSSMLASQFDTLESPEAEALTITVSADLPTDEQIQVTLEAIAKLT